MFVFFTDLASQVLATGIGGLLPVPVDRRRGLVLISKAMINLVNDVEFGKKVRLHFNVSCCWIFISFLFQESFMSVLEEPLRKPGVAKLQSFFDKLRRRIVCIIFFFTFPC